MVFQGEQRSVRIAGSQSSFDRHSLDILCLRQTSLFRHHSRKTFLASVCDLSQESPESPESAKSFDSFESRQKPKAHSGPGEDKVAMPVLRKDRSNVIMASPVIVGKSLS